MSALPRDFLTEIAHKYGLSPEQEAVFVALYSRSDNNVDRAAEAIHISPRTFQTRMTGVYRKFSIGGRSSGKAYKLANLLNAEYKKVSLAVTAATSNITDLIQAVRRHCFNTIKRNHSQIQLLNRQHISVSHLYVDVYVLNNLASETPVDSKQFPSDYDSQTDRLWLGERKHQESVSGVKIANEKARLVVLGKPGSGKSTFLRYLAEACRQGEFCPGYIPVLIFLGEVDSPDFNLLKLIQSEFEPDLVSVEQTQQILKQGQVLILLDGVDEVSQTLQRSVLHQLRDFSRKYGNNKYILTCRTQTTEYMLCGFDYVEVADFDEPKVTQFVQRWFAAFPEGDSKSDLSEAFLQKLRSPEQERIARLAVTPILLSLVCWIYTHCQDLPTKRSDLYKRGIELLLKDWDKKKGVQRDSNHPIVDQLTPTDKQNLLSHLAFRKLEQPDNFRLFEQDEILKLIAEYFEISLDDSETVLQAMESHHGLLIERAQSYWSFSHLTFQEYFVARAIVESCDSTMLKKFVKNVTEKRWREVFLLVVEMLPEDKVDELVRLMKVQVDGLLAGDETLQRFLRWVHQKSSSVNAPYKPAAVRAFYFALAFNYALNRVLVLNVPSTLVIDRIRDFALAFDYTFDSTLALDLDRTLKYALEDALNSNPNFTHRIDGAYLLTSDSKLYEKLRNLEDELPCKPYNNQENFKEWWHINGQAWIKLLRSAMIEHRNIGHDWQFGEEQNQSLQQYCDANKLLVDCLNLPDLDTSQDVREKIEATLLLPMRT